MICLRNTDILCFKKFSTSRLNQTCACISSQVKRMLKWKRVNYSLETNATIDSLSRYIDIRLIVNNCQSNLRVCVWNRLRTHVLNMDSTCSATACAFALWDRQRFLDTCTFHCTNWNTCTVLLELP